MTAKDNKALKVKLIEAALDAIALGEHSLASRCLESALYISPDQKENDGYEVIRITADRILNNKYSTIDYLLDKPFPFVLNITNSLYGQTKNDTMSQCEFNERMQASCTRIPDLTLNQLIDGEYELGEYEFMVMKKEDVFLVIETIFSFLN